MFPKSQPSTVALTSAINPIQNTLCTSCLVDCRTPIIITYMKVTYICKFAIYSVIQYYTSNMLKAKLLRERNLQTIITIIPDLRQSTSNGVNYQCVCGNSYRSHKNRLLNHLLKCKQIDAALQRYSIRMSQSLSLQQTNSQMFSNFSTSQSIIVDMQQQINQLNAKILSIKPEEMQDLKSIQLSKTYAHVFWKENLSIIQHQFQTGFQEIFHEVLLRKQLPTKYFQQMKKKIIGWISQLNFHQLIDDYHIQLEKAHKILIQEKQKTLTGQRSLQGYLRGYGFWSKFPTMRDYSKIIIEIQQLKPRTKDEVFRYYKQIQKLTTYPLPSIPYKIFTHKPLACLNNRKKPTIQDMRLLVTNLIEKGFVKTACDFWYCCTMGLRKKQMLRVKMKNQSGQYYDAINLLEKKNKHYCLRPVPMSLKKLMKKYQVEYPFTLKRIQAMQEIASKMNRRFYGYRSVCITQLISAFSNSVLQTHSSPSITQRHYLNQSSFSFINSFFKLSITDGIEQVKQSGIYLRQTENFDFAEVALKENDLLISIEDLMKQMNPEEQEQQQIALSGVQNTISLQEISQQHRFISYLYRNYQIQFDGTCYNSIKQALNECIEDRHFLQIYQAFFLTNQQSMRNISLFLKQVYEINLQVLEIRQDQQSEKDFSDIRPPSDTQIIILMVQDSTEVHYKISDHEIKFAKTKKRSQLMNKRYSGLQNVLQFIKKSPKCTYCSRTLQSKQCNDHLYYTCSVHQSNHKCLSIPDRLKTRHKPLLIAFKNPVKIRPNFKQIGFVATKNNIADILELSHRLPIKSYMYYNTCPNDLVNTKLNCAIDQETKQMISQNRQKQDYLPVKVEKISQEKGYGVISKAFIPKDTLLCSYLGCIGTNQNQMNGDDSQFSCGFVIYKDQVRELIIYARQYANVGRYLNSPTDQQNANCRAEVVLIPKIGDHCQISVLYITKRYISPNQELTVSYPSQLWTRMRNEQQSISSNCSKARSINSIYQHYPLQFKQFVYKRSIISQSRFNTKQYESLISSSEEESYEHLQKLKPPIENQIANFFSQSKDSSQKNLIGRYSDSSFLKEKYKQYQSIEQFSLLYPRVINVQGDGNCLFRSIAFMYFIIDFQKASKFFFSIPENMTIFTHQMNLQKKKVGTFLAIFFKKSAQNRKNSWSYKLKSLWTQRLNLDAFFCQFLRKSCLKELSNNFGSYQSFFPQQQLQKMKRYLQRPNYQALDAIPYAISNILQVKINIWLLNKKQLKNHLIGEQFQKGIDLVLIRQHYLIALSPKILSDFVHFQQNTDKIYLQKYPIKLANKKKSNVSEPIIDQKEEHNSQLLNQIQTVTIQFLPSVVASQTDLLHFEHYLEFLEEKFGQFGGVKIQTSLKIDKQRLLSIMKNKKINCYKQSLQRLSDNIYQYKNYATSNSRHNFNSFWDEDREQKFDFDLNDDLNFWKDIQTKKIGSQYSPDNDFQLSSDIQCLWTCECVKSLFNKIVTQQVVGINTPFVFIGKKNSVFGFHKEDYNLSAINLQLIGKPKIWYVLDKQNSVKFQKFMASQLAKIHVTRKNCEQPLNHKDLIVNPYLLQSLNINAQKVIQREGEIVVVFSQCYHSGFNAGSNINEAINFGNKSWIQSYLSFKNCNCGIIPKLNHKEILRNMQTFQNEPNESILNSQLIARYQRELKK